MISERLKILRKELGINQSEFGSSIGLRQSTIGNYESGSRNISDAIILSICREYGVNENWLRNGKGDMFESRQISPSAISALSKDYDLDAMDEALISEYLKLDKKDRSVLKSYIRNVFLAADEELMIEREVEAYHQELIREKRAADESGASGISGEKMA